MIHYLQGTIQSVYDRAVTLVVNNVGFQIFVARVTQFTPGTSISLFTHLHWHPDQGPTLFGFTQELEKQVFLLIIECPKIGPTIALNILSHLTASQFLQAILTQNDKILSAVNGIGQKKAEQIIVELKHKVQKLINTGAITLEESHEQSGGWIELQQALTALNYSNQEITHVIHYLTQKYAEKTVSSDQLLRSALTFLAEHSTQLR